MCADARIARFYSVQSSNTPIEVAVYIGEMECGDVAFGIYSLSKSRSRRISLPAAAKSP